MALIVDELVGTSCRCASVATGGNPSWTCACVCVVARRWELLDLSLDAEESLVVPQRLAADLAAVVDPQFVELPPREAREVSRPTCPSALAPRGSAALP